MTREEELDWLYRLRSEIYVYMPKEWLIPMNNALDMAIKDVEQQPFDDCVSIAELEKWLDSNFSFGGACRKLELFDRLEKELPRVTPTQSWIPVSEILPKESDGAVLITVNGEVNTGRYSEFTNTWYKGDMRGVGGDNPIAWMPLPKPYGEN